MKNIILIIIFNIFLNAYAQINDKKPIREDRSTHNESFMPPEGSYTITPLSTLNIKEISDKECAIADYYYNIKDFKSAYFWIDKVETLGEMWDYLYFKKGVCEYENKEYQKSIISFSRCIELAKNKNDFYKKGNSSMLITETLDELNNRERDSLFNFKISKLTYFLENKINDSLYTNVVYGDGRFLISTYDLIPLVSKADVYIQRGNVKSQLEDYRGAIADYSKAIEIENDPNNKKGRYYINPNCYALAYFNRGLAKSNLKDYNGSLIDFSKVIALNPKEADAYYNRGLSKLNLNQKESACLDFSKAGELGHENAYELIKKYCNN